MSTKWHKGPPPSVGWWPASFAQDARSLRWWNGYFWSGSMDERDSPELISATVARKGLLQDLIMWTDRPANWPPQSYT